MYTTTGLVLAIAALANAQTTSLDPAIQSLVNQLPTDTVSSSSHPQDVAGTRTDNGLQAALSLSSLQASLASDYSNSAAAIASQIGAVSLLPAFDRHRRMAILTASTDQPSRRFIIPHLHTQRRPIFRGRLSRKSRPPHPNTKPATQLTPPGRQPSSPHLSRLRRPSAEHPNRRERPRQRKLHTQNPPPLSTATNNCRPSSPSKANTPPSTNFPRPPPPAPPPQS